MTNPSSSGGLLADLRVLDLSLWQPGHTATQLLADLGSQVLKVEPPEGDRMRAQADRFANFNGHKRSVALNLKDQLDRQRLYGYVAQAEVVVENYRPGVGARLGVGFADLVAVNPSIVLCSITGFGQSGRLAMVPGHDHNYQAYAGAYTFSPGEEPVPAGLLVGDQGSGLAAAFAILAAVLCARRTGEGEHIDVSITDLLAAWVVPMGPIDQRSSPAHNAARLPGMGVFATADGGWVELGVFSEDHFWDVLCDTLEVPQGVGLGMAERAEQAAELRAAIAGAIRRRDRDELVEQLTERAVPVAPVLTREEMLAHPHFRERGIVATAEDGTRAIGHPIQYARHPALPSGRAPAVDEHADVGFG